jgi:catechol 2,3-dioxygenase-like lactoylglutathione lyase family enzyme
MIRPIALAEAHMECRRLDDTVPVLTDLLAFDVIAREPGSATLKHPNTNWPLVVHEAGPNAPAKQMHNHFGVRVQHKTEIDAAYAYLAAHQIEYGVSELQPPEFSHGSYSVYLVEPGTNGLEIECYEDVLRKESGGARLGGVRAHHWDTPLPESRFPGHGYVPQALTHGTLACTDAKRSAEFYTQVLGLEAHRAYERISYVKHPDARHYIVCGTREQHNCYSPNFRFTIAVSSDEEVQQAHDWLAADGNGLGVTDLTDIADQNGAAAFLLCDPDGNWWEVASARISATA